MPYLSRIFMNERRNGAEGKCVKQKHLTTLFFCSILSQVVVNGKDCRARSSI